LPAMNMRDGHEVLGVQPDASLAEVKAAYHKRVKRCHPDHNPSKAAAQEFLDLTAAFERLNSRKSGPTTTPATFGVMRRPRARASREDVGTTASTHTHPKDVNWWKKFAKPQLVVHTSTSRLDVGPASSRTARTRREDFSATASTRTDPEDVNWWKKFAKRPPLVAQHNSTISQCDDIDEMRRYASRVRLYVGKASRRTARVDEYVRWRRATAWRSASETATKHAHESAHE